MPFVAEVVIPDSSVDSIEAAVSGLANQAAEEMMANPDIPSLYDAAARGLVVYRKESPERQTFITPSLVLRRRWGDCKHFSAWRVAELRRAGRKAIITVIDRRDDEHPGRFHAVVEHDSGEIEDPSQIVIALEGQGASALGGTQPMRTSFAVKPNNRGRGYVAAVSAPIHRRHRMALACCGDTRAEALDRVTSLAQQLSSDPAIAMLMPPTAVAAIAGMHLIARAARNGTLDDLIGQLVGPHKVKVAKVLQGEMHDLIGAARRQYLAACDPHNQYKLVSRRGNVCTYADTCHPGSTFQGDCTQAPSAHGVPTSGTQSTAHRTTGGTSSGRGVPTGGAMAPTARARTTPGTPQAPHPLDDPYGGYGAPPTPGGWPGATGPDGSLYDPSGQYVWSGDHWERPRASQQGYDPSQDPYAQWGQGLDPYLYPGQQPYAPGWDPFAPSAMTSTHPPQFQGGGWGVELPDPSSAAWYSQDATEAFFNQGAWTPQNETWADEFYAGSFLGPQDQGGGYAMSDVGYPHGVDSMADLADVSGLDDIAGGDPDRYELLVCAKGAGWFDGNDPSGVVAPQGDPGMVMSDVADVT